VGSYFLSELEKAPPDCVRVPQAIAAKTLGGNGHENRKLHRDKIGHTD